MKIADYRAINKNTLKASFDLELQSGMVIKGFTLHDKNGSRWVNYPAQKYEKEDGTVGWARLIYFPEKEVHEQFQTRVLSTLDAYLARNKTGTDDEVPF